MTGQIVAAVVTLVLLTVAPGPDVAVVTRAALGGRVAARRAAVGITTGLLLWGTLTVGGLAALLAASATAYSVVKYVCGAYLLWLGLSTLWRTRRRVDDRGEELAPLVVDPVTGDPVAVTAVEAETVPARSTLGSGMANPFRTGFMSNILNPKIAVFYTGLLPQLVPDGVAHTPGLIALVAFHVAITLGWLLLYGVIVRRTADRLQRPSAQRLMERITGLVLVGFGARVLTTTHR
ncbi:MAG: LysE family translocator [Solirubrobacteraceae bacterium]|nr:LysE family translocator [Patulibacter sp.]